MASTTLNRLSIGLEGISPSILLLQTNLTNLQIQEVGFLNNIADSAAVTASPSDFVLANCVDGSEYYTISVGANRLFTLEPAGGVIPEGFKYVNSYWLASNGVDSNDGKSIESPKRSLGAIAPLLVAGIPTVINIADAGVYTLNSIFSVNCPLFINASNAHFSWSGSPSGNMFFLFAASPMVINVNSIDASGTLQIFRGFSSIICNCPSIANAERIWEDANTISPNGVPEAVFNISTDFSGGTFLFKYSGFQLINAVNLGISTISSLLTSGSGPLVQINAQSFSGNIEGTADYLLNIANLGSFNNTTTGNVSGAFNNTFGGIVNTPVSLAGNIVGAGYQSNIVKRKIITTSGNTIYLDHTMSGAEIVLVDNTVIVGLQSYATEPNYPEGFYVDLVQQFAPSGCEINGVSATDVFIRQPTAYPFFTGAGAARVYLAKNATFVGDPNIWVITGDVFNSN